MGSFVVFDTAARRVSLVFKGLNKKRGKGIKQIFPAFVVYPASISNRATTTSTEPSGGIRYGPGNKGQISIYVPFIRDRYTQ